MRVLYKRKSVNVVYRGHSDVHRGSKTATVQTTQVFTSSRNKGMGSQGDITCEPSSENTDARMWNHCNVPYPGDMKKVGIHKSDLI